MRERLPIALVLVLAAVLLTSLHAVGAPLSAETPPSTTSPLQPPVEQTRATGITAASLTSAPTAAVPPASACAPRPLGVTPVEGPRGLAAGPDAFYVALFDSSQVAAVNQETRARLWQRPSGPGRTNWLALSGDTLVTRNGDTGTITLHRADTGDQVAVIPAGKLPWGVSAGARTPTPTRTVASTATPANTLRPTGTPSPRPTSTLTATNRPSATLTATPSPTPVAVRAKVEIVWPHGGAGVQDAELANVTAYLLAGDGTGTRRSLLDSVPCNWNPTVRLWAAQNNLPAREVGVGTKRMVRGGGRRFPAWDFNDVDVSEAKDPANKIAFFVTVDDGSLPVGVLHNAWTHAADARTLFPQQDTPTYATRLRPDAVDARIEIVWPQDNLPVQEAKSANVTAYLFNAATLTGISPDTAWSPVVRLHRSINNEPEAAPGLGVLGTRRVVTAANGVQFLAWDFNDVDVSAANDPLNRIYFSVSVDGVPTYGNVWAHGADVRTLFPQPDVLNNCT